ncbi:ribosome biogenesis protein NOP53 [Toxorhynchites rutilus septentrionalis]|uniref:ribosome biogenesis protein NOP53 n=1 Tax=Toxorhynchites rutilus septentrionalis TaxID=329112 RepID=UPI00247874AB|nr:ribosome biogenesis protein NOP53 [Toxorhynchites rutilus septentrionalis]
MNRASRKNKSAWRKNIDITDVDTFLEEQRQDERVGHIADKSNDDLFCLDVSKNSPKSNLKSIRKKKFAERPKSLSSLENASKVSDPIVKRNIISNASKLSLLAKKEAKSKERKFPSRALKKTQQLKDIWEEEDSSLGELKNEWFNENVVLHHLKQTGKPKVKVADSTHAKPYEIPNVELPAGGISYNPSIDDYNTLKQAIIEKEKQKIKAERHLDRVITQKFGVMSKEQRDKQVLMEMSEGLFDQEEKEVVTNEDEEDYAAINLPVENKKKDRRARNRKTREIAKRNAKVSLDIELKKLKDINRMAELNGDINKKQKITKRKQENRTVRLEEKRKMPGRVAYLKFEEAEPDFAEPADLTDSLRGLVSSRSLLADRYKSFQKRTLIAPKKYRDGIPRSNRSTLKKWKRYVLDSHKEI